MHAANDHFLLCTEASNTSHTAPRWKFVLQSVDGDERLVAADFENETRHSRLELLAVVRGLEAIGRPARVTLLTRSRYVSRGIRRQLSHWREHQWQWERFGKLVPIRDQDLWRRVDRALEFHRVDCRAWHVNDRTANGRGTSRWHPSGPVSIFAAALATLRRGVLTPLAGLWRPTFTRAA
jgi:ribonuclease HI